jgi:hypothetical protein
MDRTTRFAAIGLLCVGTSALSFGETFVSVQSSDWDNTYNASTALFSAVVQQGAASLASGLASGTAVPLTSLFGNGGSGQDFTLTYDPTSPADGATTLTIGGIVVDAQTLTVAAAGGGLDHIGIALGAGAEETITISGISINGVDTTGNDPTSKGPGLFDFTMDPTTDLTGGLTLKGTITMSWPGASGSDISAEIVGADAPVVTPEPGTWALLGSALAGLGLLRRKRTV